MTCLYSKQQQLPECKWRDEDAYGCCKCKTGHNSYAAACTLVQSFAAALPTLDHAGYLRQIVWPAVAPMKLPQEMWPQKRKTPHPRNVAKAQMMSALVTPDPKRSNMNPPSSVPKIPVSTVTAPKVKSACSPGIWKTSLPDFGPRNAYAPMTPANVQVKAVCVCIVTVIKYFLAAGSSALDGRTSIEGRPQDATDIDRVLQKSDDVFPKQSYDVTFLLPTLSALVLVLLSTSALPVHGSHIIVNISALTLQQCTPVTGQRAAVNSPHHLAFSCPPGQVG